VEEIQNGSWIPTVNSVAAVGEKDALRTTVWLVGNSAIGH
jgi:hypothetical protein